jgi:hypothetical protein
VNTQDDEPSLSKLVRNEEAGKLEEVSAGSYSLEAAPADPGGP